MIDRSCGCLAGKDADGSTSAARASTGARAAVWGGSGGGSGTGDGVRDAVHMAAALPHALRASATSKAGIDELKVLRASPGHPAEKYHHARFDIPDTLLPATTTQSGRCNWLMSKPILGSLSICLAGQWLHIVWRTVCPKPHIVLQEATVRLLSERAFAEQLATGHGPSGAEGGFDSQEGRRQVDRGLLGGAAAEAVPAF